MKINWVKGTGFFFLFLLVIGLFVSFLFNVNFVETYLDDNGNIADHVKIRVDIFQQQMFFISLFFGVIGIIIIKFNERIGSFLKTNKGLVLNALVLISVVLLLFVLGEVVLRLFFAEQLIGEYGHGVGYQELMNNSVFNSFGYRDVEHEVKKEEGAFRILVFGDSFTFGAGIADQEKVYARLLQQKLGEKFPDREFEVINISWHGYSTIDEVKFLEEQGLELDPDLIVLGYFLNDAEGTGSQKGFENLATHHFLIPYEVGGWFYSNSFMYYFLESRTKNLLLNYGFGKSNEDYLKHLYTDSNPVFAKHKSLFEKFIRLGKENQIPVVVMDIPVPIDYNAYPFYLQHEYVKDVSLSSGALYFNLIDYFSKYDFEDLKVSFMDGHMNELGHEITANALLEFFEKENLLAKA